MVVVVAVVVAGIEADESRPGGRDTRVPPSSVGRNRLSSSGRSGVTCDEV